MPAVDSSEMEKQKLECVDEFGEHYEPLLAATGTLSCACALQQLQGWNCACFCCLGTKHTSVSQHRAPAPSLLHWNDANIKFSVFLELQLQQWRLQPPYPGHLLPTATHPPTPENNPQPPARHIHSNAGPDTRTVSSTILVAIPANLQAGEAVSTNMLRQRSVQGTLMDIEAPVTGIPMALESGAAAGNPGQLVFLPDLPSTVQMWHNQRPLMLVWLASSLISLVLFAPLFMASGLFLAAEIAAIMGVIAAVVQLCERELAAVNSECAQSLARCQRLAGACCVRVCVQRVCTEQHAHTALQACANVPCANGPAQ